MPGGRNTFWETGPNSFSTYAALYDPETFQNMLVTR